MFNAIFEYICIHKKSESFLFRDKGGKAIFDFSHTQKKPKTNKQTKTKKPNKYCHPVSLTHNQII